MAASAISNRVSHWTPAYFGVALLDFLVVQGLMVGGWVYPAQPLMVPATFAAVHLLVLGWLTLLMFGALFQFVPVITSRQLPSQKLALVALILMEAGVLGMVAGFSAMALGSERFVHCLPVGGSLVALGACIAIGDIVVPLAGARPLELPGRFVLAGFAFLITTMTLGLLLALGLTVPAWAPALAPLLGGGVGYHALAGIGGWFTLTAIGVSYKLLPMFMLAPEERGWVGDAVLGLTATGFVLVVGAEILNLFVPLGAVALVAWIGFGAVAAGIVLYLVDVVRMYRTRRRALIELQNRVSVGAFVALAACLLLFALLLATGSVARYVGVLGFLVLFGWLSGLGLSQLFKVVAFLAWLELFGSKLGRGPVPRVQDLVNEKRAAPWFTVYFAAVAVGTVAGLLGYQLAWRAAVAVCMLSTIFLGVEYWRAYRGKYAASMPARPASFPLPLPEGKRPS